MKSVVHNFLGTYLSRNTGYQGYWLFGYLVDFIAAPLEFNLLEKNFQNEPAPLETAIKLAVEKFAIQCEKGNVEMTCIRRATVRFSILQERVQIKVNQQNTEGKLVLAQVMVEMNNRKQFQALRRIMIAAHNPNSERKNNR